jgi:hypothetical protein
MRRWSSWLRCLGCPVDEVRRPPQRLTGWGGSGFVGHGSSVAQAGTRRGRSVRYCGAALLARTLLGCIMPLSLQGATKMKSVLRLFRLLLCVALAGCASIASALNNAAFGQTIDLVCNGEVHQYEPNPVEGTAGPGAAWVDLGLKRISTPVGDFRITKVEETAIYFDEPGKPLKVFGYLDRSTGRMTVFWRRPEEEAKMQAGLPSNMVRYAVLACSVSKRLF